MKSFVKHIKKKSNNNSNNKNIGEEGEDSVEIFLKSLKLYQGFFFLLTYYCRDHLYHCYRWTLI